MYCVRRILLLFCGASIGPLYLPTLLAQSPHFYKVDSTEKEINFRTFCKSYIVFSTGMGKGTSKIGGNSKHINLKITGNILYDLNYRSLIDTPFAARDYIQQVVQTRLHFLIADKYPIQLLVSSRRSNSNYFKNYYDISVRFEHQNFNSSIKEKLKAALQQKFEKELSLVDIHYKEWQNKYSDLSNTKSFITDPAQIQRLVEAKEFIARQKNRLPETLALPSFKAGSLGTALSKKASGKIHSETEAKDFIEKFEEKKSSVDSLTKKVALLKNTYTSHKQRLDKKVDSLKTKINQAKNSADLKNIDRSALDSLSTKDKFLLGLKTISIGRSPVNYSELSVKNISVTGINVEYNANYYWAVAVGTIDYRFRDFIVRATKQPSQHLGLVRFGKGDVDKNHVILTAFRGQKANYTFSGTSSYQPVFGLTIEARYQISDDTYVIGEAANSSKLSAMARGGNRKPVFNLSDKTTNAFSVRFNSALKKTNTKLAGSYRMVGPNFQSFSLYNSTAAQSSWNLSLDQYLLRRVVNIKASIRKNEFDNPYALINYQSNTVFKSVFLSVRKKHFPYLSMGYMPTSQLTKIDKQLYENYFHMLIGTVSHFYKIGRLRANTLLTGSKYFNSGSDSGFLYSNSKNIILSTTVSGKTVNAVTTLSNSSAPQYKLFVLDQGVNFNFQSGVSLGMGIKVARLNSNSEQVGYYGNCILPLKQIGSLSLSYETSYLPGITKSLVPNDVGRITYFKRF